MKITKFTIIAGLFIGSAVISSCTKADRGDDFPAGDVPPVAGGFTSAAGVAATNLVAYWSFDGAVKDNVSGTVGTNHNMTFTPGLKGQALTGSANQSLMAYATSPASPAVASMTQYTVSMWVNTPQNVGATGIFSIGHSSEFWANVNVFFENGGTTSKARFKTIFRNGTFQADNDIQDVENGFNNWTNYTITYDDKGTFRSYVNGSLARERTGAPATPVALSSIAPIVFGALHFMTTPSGTSATTAQSWAGYLIGKLDEVRIYNKALSPIEISGLSILERRGQ